MDAFARVRATIDAYDLLARGSAVVVAVSGGPDSLCLLHVLLRLRDELHLRLHVAHLNHGLRPEADDEAQFVAGLAAQWGLPCTVGKADVRGLAAAEHRSLEEAARVARYRFLAQVARAQGAGLVAVAHNADDQVETVLMHCLRGAGLPGLRGMRRRAPWPVEAADGCPGPALIRPLLDVPRAAIEAYDREQGLEPRYDVTNLEVTYFRNRIRHELVPVLESYNPRIRELLHRTADVLADDYAYLQQSLAELWPLVLLAETPGSIALRADGFRRLGQSPQRAIIRRAIRALRRSLRDIGWVHVERARKAAVAAPTGTIITLPAGLVLEVGYDRLLLRPAGPPQPRPERLALVGPERRLAVPGVTELAPGGWAIEAQVGQQCPVPEPGLAGQLRVCFDAERAGGDLYLRTRQPGDRFRPRGLQGHSKSVKDFMIDAKIPRAERECLPLVVSEQGILWIGGWRASEIGEPGPDTQCFLCLRLVPPPAAGPVEQAGLGGHERLAEGPTAAHQGQSGEPPGGGRL